MANKNTNKIISYLSISATLIFPGILALAIFVPEYLPFFGLNVKKCYMAAMQLMSLILLLSFIQTPKLEWRWQIFTLIFSFIILGESWFIMLH